MTDNKNIFKKIYNDYEYYLYNPLNILYDLTIVDIFLIYIISGMFFYYYCHGFPGVRSRAGGFRYVFNFFIFLFAIFCCPCYGILVYYSYTCPAQLMKFTKYNPHYDYSFNFNTSSIRKINNI